MFRSPGIPSSCHPAQATLALAFLLAFLLPFLLVCPVGRAAIRDDDDAFFKKGAIPLIRIELAAESADALRREPRAYAPATLVVDGKPLSTTAGVKLKGAAGSFQAFDERPALTVDVDRFGDAPLFHGMEKFHLNNSVQDPSLLAEWVAAEILERADYPHVRVGHARVQLGDRDLGVYVLKESFDERFLARAFPGRKAAGGNLYDGGFCQDVDAELERDEGSGPDERADLRALAAACRDSDVRRRWERIEKIVDVRTFVRFVALEAMLGHWDGYSFNSNNYRLYFEPGGRATFLLHGMDQVLQDPGSSVLDHPRGLVASSVLRNPKWREQYRREVSRLLDCFAAEKFASRIAAVQQRVQAALRASNPEAAAAQATEAEAFVQRLVARGPNLAEQSRAPEPKPLSFRVGRPIVVRGWHPMSESEDAIVEEVDLGGTRVFRAACGPSGRCVAGWRKSVLVERGRYRLSALMRVEGVERLEETEAPGVGAGIRISGADRRAQPDAETTGSGERRLNFEFEVTESMADVELVIELRASRGSAAFAIESLTLERLSSRPTPKQPDGRSSNPSSGAND